MKLDENKNIGRLVSVQSASEETVNDPEVNVDPVDVEADNDASVINIENNNNDEEESPSEQPKERWLKVYSSKTRYYFQ